MKNIFGAAVIAAGSTFGLSANAATTDLAFILDFSGSIDNSDFESAAESLADALAASIPVDDPNNRYTLTVIRFAETSGAGDVIVGQTTLDSQNALDTAVQSIRDTPNNTNGVTCYACAFENLNAVAAANGDNSIINMMTDGEPNEREGDQVAQRDALIASGWDSLSFEAINLNLSGTTLLQSLAFDTIAVGGQPLLDDPNDITNPLDSSFVLNVQGFGLAYDQAISTKVQRIVAPVVPAPAGLPLALTGIAAFAALRLRGRKPSAD